ncbi:hypothetical protein DI09_22p80 [Mitosporidium daphniae]|uniref:Uncharacterized protein n=1 Tax=Mitosporidium daphniae TaxID=1485682 RepID=A0A098VSD2_9MICR|nr:uncharacterized protein DI09_22p80 [Mitosporidium daphniae]KGG51983.1 hypothetical protein DI09_22p80 [Mitosporidium daphniae]|eukprot:XP_013238439.1 uncharacterized protein DI09_22p80 [Mitosporidium daphniae]
MASGVRTKKGRAPSRHNKCIPLNISTLTCEREPKPSAILTLPSSQSNIDKSSSEPADLDDELEAFYKSMQKKLLRRTSLQKRAIEQQINDALAQTIEAVNEHLQDLEKSMYRSIPFS